MAEAVLLSVDARTQSENPAPAPSEAAAEEEGGEVESLVAPSVAFTEKKSARIRSGTMRKKLSANARSGSAQFSR